MNDDFDTGAGGNDHDASEVDPFFEPAPCLYCDEHGCAEECAEADDAMGWDDDDWDDDESDEDWDDDTDYWGGEF